MNEDDDIFFKRFIFAITFALVFLALTIVLMIPILNVFIASKLFSDNPNGGKHE